MKCTTTTRFRGRNVELFTTDTRVSQVDHTESMRIDGGGFCGIGGSKSSENHQMLLHLEDGEQVSVAELGSRFPVHAGEHLTAVGANVSGKKPSFLYFYNHDRRKGMFYRPGWKRIKRSSWRAKLFVLLPLILLFGLWMSPEQTRADMASWVDQHIVVENAATRVAADDGQNRRVSSETNSTSSLVHSFVSHTVGMAGSLPLDRADTVIRGEALPRVTAGWRDRDWMTFGATAVVLCLLLLVSRRILGIPSTILLRRRVKRLMKQHRLALEAA
jgi:hypothetical protein